MNRNYNKKDKEEMLIPYWLKYKNGNKTAVVNEKKHQDLESNLRAEQKEIYKKFHESFYTLAENLCAYLNEV